MSENEARDDCVCSEVNAFRISSLDDSEDSNTLNIVTSVFRFSQPSWWNEETNKMLKQNNKVSNVTTTIEEDSDGDYDVLRSCGVADDLSLEIEHKLSTRISHVGHQVWRGSLLMADYLLLVMILIGIPFPFIMLKKSCILYSLSIIYLNFCSTKLQIFLQTTEIL